MAEKEDVAEVLDKLKEEIRRRRPAETDPALGERAASLQSVYATMRVSSHLPIGWPKLPPGILPKLVAVMQKVVRRLLRWYINPIVEQQNAFNSASTRVMETLLQQTERLQASISQQQREREEILQPRLQRLERTLRSTRPVDSPISDAGMSVLPTVDRSAVDYFQLELRFRGPQLLKDRQIAYVKYFQGRQNVLDIGCGRGEFVEMLIQKGISAWGVDLDADAVAYAQERGVPVELSEASAYLRSLPDQSLGGLFAAQVVEHLHPQHLAHLLELCHDKMQPDAPIVLETLNPVCLWSLVNYFIMDPTHVWPVHSEMLKFLLESAGFGKVEIQYLSPVPLRERLFVLPEHSKLRESDPETFTLLNHNIQRANDFLFGHQEYAAIAWRPSRDMGESL